MEKERQKDGWFETAIPQGLRGGVFFRRLFLVNLLVISAALLIAAWWVSRVGVPDVVKQELLAQVRASGWEMEFSRLRWGWHAGILADNLQLQRIDPTTGPRIFAENVQCRLNKSALARLKLQIESVKLQGGRVVYPAIPAQQNIPILQARDLQGELRFVSTNLWELHDFSGRIMDASIRINGSLTNASVLKDWKIPERKSKPKSRKGEPFWRKLATTMEKIELAQSPEITGEFRLDASHLDEGEATLHVQVPGVVSPWGSAGNINLRAQLSPPSNPEAEARVDVQFEARNASTQWGLARSLTLRAVLEPTLSRWLPTNSTSRLELFHVTTPWGGAEALTLTHKLTVCETNVDLMQTELIVESRQARYGRDNAWRTATNSRAPLRGPPLVQGREVMLQARLVHSTTNWAPFTLDGNVHANEITSRPITAQRAAVKLLGSVSAEARRGLSNTNLTWPARLEGVAMEATARMDQAQIGHIAFPRLYATNRWQDLRWVLGLGGHVPGGFLAARAQLDTPSGELACSVNGPVDPSALVPLLRSNISSWVEPLQCATPPAFELEAGCRMPSWTNHHAPTLETLLPGLWAQGRLDLGAFTYRGASFQRLRLPFELTNQALRVPGMELGSAQGDLKLGGRFHFPSKNFEARVDQAMNPAVFQPMVAGRKATNIFDIFRFSEPPQLSMTASGSLTNPAAITGSGNLFTTNFAIRGELFSSCRTAIAISNQSIFCVNPVVLRPNEVGSAPLVTVDLKDLKLYLTNAHGNLNPYAVTRAVGAKTGRVIAPYRFERPPEARVDGVVDLKKGSSKDHLIIQAAGGAFHWGPFNLSQLQGHVEWNGDIVQITRVEGMMHGGHIQGDARFDSSPAVGSDFTFQLEASEVNMRNLIQDLNPKAKTNKLDGFLSGRILVSHANTDDWESWQGSGKVRLRDGVIWDIPIFGVFSPVLNTVIPGLGNSVAREGTASFTISNSVIHSTDLQIHASATRLQFKGTVDFDQRINGRMEAELLRDVPGIGLLFSKIFWPVTKLFEYRMYNTLGDPKTEPLYVFPRLLSLPFLPFKAIKEIIQAAPQSGPSNAAPAEAPTPGSTAQESAPPKPPEQSPGPP